ncbi:hypothetical protein [Methylocapsa palsarum]|uniref:Uncharacterized protein n=1 Tax=Methylocapsa palsarum TaxID=1612308 RepID=A0A1I4AGJ8_9HYPH|nr:hypothetical protein [Methylocapsa palsarum]SFK55393.1 hypothetical protein SAMN05444581_11082 [Methylocapsa palsarum]
MRKVFQESLVDIHQHIQLIAPKAEISTILKHQLTWLASGYYCYCGFGGYIRQFDHRKILAEIAHLENKALPTATKPESEFPGILKGFWHKHFPDENYLLKNIMLENKKNFYKYLYKDAANIYKEKTGNTLFDSILDEKMISPMTYVSFFGALEDRMGNNRLGTVSRMTGEWIVYTHDEAGRLHYLTLAVHDEKVSLYRSIVQRVFQTAADFPFVSEKLGNNGVKLPNSR